MKPAATLVFVIVLLVLFANVWAQTSKRNKRVAVTPNNPPMVSLKVSASTINLPCPPTMHPYSRAACPAIEDSSLQLTATASDPDGDSLLYTYKVSGGHINGEGPIVSWDLRGIAPGAYTATVEVDDGWGGLTTARSTIKVVLCSDCIPNEALCPTISVSCPDEVESNSSATFKAAFSQGMPIITQTYNGLYRPERLRAGRALPRSRSIRRALAARRLPQRWRLIISILLAIAPSHARRRSGRRQYRSKTSTRTATSTLMMRRQDSITSQFSCSTCLALRVTSSVMARATRKE